MKVYRPTSLVIVDRAAFVVGSTIFTSAPATAAFCGSVTSPLMVPAEVACAQADAVAMHAISSQRSKEETRNVLSLACRFINPS
jgi:hypothetical protein